MLKHLVVSFFLVATVFAQVPDLRSAAGCGPADVKFDVKTDKRHVAVTKSVPDKALVFVISQQKSAVNVSSFPFGTERAITRVGLDGNWVGANHGNSYVSFTANPGVHHVCTDWQSVVPSKQKLSGAADLPAEAGKTYYYLAEVMIESQDHPPRLWLKAVDESEGLLLLSKSESSTGKAKD